MLLNRPSVSSPYHGRGHRPPARFRSVSLLRLGRRGLGIPASGAAPALCFHAIVLPANIEMSINRIAKKFLDIIKNYKFIILINSNSIGKNYNICHLSNDI